ncbi:MAG: cytochrome c [Acidobacteria bacterium]|nr:cytochrome c [Acidobacteriota bacterium]
MKKLFGAAVLLLAAAVATAQEPKPAAQAAPAGNAETGATLWRNVGCWQCHGYEAQGGAAGPRLSGRNLPWTGFSAYVRRPANQMPLYTEKVLPTTDLAHIYAYVQSRPAPAQNVPLLQK